MQRHYSNAHNVLPAEALSVDSTQQVFWRLACGCIVYKSPHAISNRKRRCSAGTGGGGCAFGCAFHGTAARQASAPSRAAFAVLCRLAAVTGRCTVVWEAHAVQGTGPCDFWLLEWGVLVEVDGAQHTEGTIHGMDAEERMLRDQQKDAAALRGGFHVVRLHVYDTPWWQQVVRGAMVESRLGLPVRVHYTPYYVVPTPLLGP